MNTLRSFQAAGVLTALDVAFAGTLDRLARGLGMEVDHVYGEFGIPAFLVETTRSGITRPADLHTYFRWYNPREPARHVRAGVGMLHAWAIATLASQPAVRPTINTP